MLAGKPEWSKPKCESISIYTHQMLESIVVEQADAGTPDAWVRMFPNATSNALSLLKQLLRFDPGERTSAAEALKHEYLYQVRAAARAPAAGRRCRCRLALASAPSAPHAPARARPLTRRLPPASHQFHNEFVEREAPVTVKVSIPDNEKRSTNHYRERLYKEVAEFRKEEKAVEEFKSAQRGGDRSYRTGVSNRAR